MVWAKGCEICLTLTMKKADEVYWQLCELIEDCELKPGETYTEQALIERTGFGRTPVREAIQRLAREHLVVARQGSRIQVPSLDVDEQLRRLEVRRPLEVLMVSLACARGTDEFRAQIRDLVDGLGRETSLAGYLEFLRASQHAVSLASGNQYLTEIMRPLYLHSRRFWSVHLRDKQAEIATGSNLHVSMLEAILSNDTRTAQSACIQLNDYLMDSALQVMQQSARLASTADRWLLIGE